MKYIISLLIVLYVISCNHSSQIKSYRDSSDIDNNDSVSNVARTYLNGIDSVAVLYWASDSYEYIYKYSKGELQITRKSLNNPFEKQISNKNIIDEFVGYIDDFFITKKEGIELNRSKSDPLVTDYPEITIELFLNSKLILKETIQYGEEGYDIEYNPKFEEFYNFLDNLVPTPKS